MKLVPSQWDPEGIDVELDNSDRVVVESFDPGTHPADLKDGETREVEGWLLIRRGGQVVTIVPAADLKPAKRALDQLEVA